MSNNIVKEYISANAQYKVSIFHRGDGLFEIITFRWTHEIVPGYGEVCAPFWESFTTPSLTDDLMIAEKIAKEELRGWSRGN